MYTVASPQGSRKKKEKEKRKGVEDCKTWAYKCKINMQLIFLKKWKQGSSRRAIIQPSDQPIVSILLHSRIFRDAHHKRKCHEVWLENGRGDMGALI